MNARRRRREAIGSGRVLALAAAIAAGPTVVGADEQTDEIMERDRRYYENQQGTDEQAAPDPARGADEERARRELQAFLEEADELIRDRNYAVKISDAYRVQSDDPRLNATAVLRLLDSFRLYFETFWSDEIPLVPYEGTGNIYLFYSYFKYNRVLTGRQRFDTLRSAGHYNPRADVVVIHTDASGPTLGDVLVHEAAHQLVEHHRLGNQSLWLSEGLASYFGYTRQDARGFHAGDIGGKSETLFAEGKPAGAGWERVQALRRSWRKLEPWPVAELLATQDQSLFLSAGVEERYTASWLLVHYLLHGDEGARRAGFLRYVTGEAEGEGGADLLYGELGMSSEELEAGFRAYVERLKPALRRVG